MRIGIFGGSFNPVHRGHLCLANAAISELNLNKIVFVPSFQNPLKQKEEFLPCEIRIKLLRKAIEKNADFLISLYEIKKRGPSYTIDTLKYFKRKFGKHEILYFLSGADVLNNIKRWKSFDEILELCRFVVMTRPGYSIKNSARRILQVPFEALPISSSNIRHRLKRGQSVRGLVPLETEKMLKSYFNR